MDKIRTNNPKTGYLTFVRFLDIEKTSSFSAKSRLDYFFNMFFLACCMGFFSEGVVLFLALKYSGFS